MVVVTEEDIVAVVEDGTGIEEIIAEITIFVVARVTASAGITAATKNLTVRVAVAEIEVLIAQKRHSDWIVPR